MTAQECLRPGSSDFLHQWDSLLPEILFSVFQVLEDADRCSARLVCRAWDWVFRWPALWRDKRSFRFGGRSRKEARLACAFLESGLGAHLRQLEVILGAEGPSHEVVMNDYRMVLDVEQFLTKALPQNMRLTSFVLVEEDSCLTKLFCACASLLQAPFEQMVDALIAFLKQQEDIGSAHLSLSSAGGKHAIRVLDAVGTKCLTRLHTEFSFNNDDDVVSRSEYMHLMGKFGTLREIGLNAFYLSDPVLAILVTSSTSLHYIRLTVGVAHERELTRMSDVGQLVTDAGWRIAVAANTQLRVAVSIRALRRLSDLYRILLPCMPLAELSIDMASDVVPSVEDMLKYLACHYADHLGYIG